MYQVAADFTKFIADRRFSTIMADPPWQFENRTGKVAPEHKRLNRYSTLSLEEICSIPVKDAAEEKSSDGQTETAQKNGDQQEGVSDER